MKNKILIIFFLAIILSFIIYKLLYKENNNILIIGQKDIVDFIDTNVDNFLYDRTTYRELLKSINNNDKKIIKEKEIYLTQMIHSSKYIIIYCDYYCNNNELTLNNINKLVDKIKSISNSKIYIIRNQCNYDLKNTENYEFINIQEVYFLINELSN